MAEGLELISLQVQTIELIKKLKLSTADVSDALGKNQWCSLNPEVKPVHLGSYAVGPIYSITCTGDSNYEVHEKLHQADIRNTIVYVALTRAIYRAVFGHLVSRFIVTKGALAIVVNGLIRDKPKIHLETDIPIWSEGFTPLGYFNEDKRYDLSSTDYSKAEFKTGDIAVCDDDGVVIISQKTLSVGFLDKLTSIHQREEKWYRGLCEGKSTFEVIYEDPSKPPV